ncbi:D-alanyl-D-alanine carboxypeptidase [Streptomyces sp. NBC_00190]|uniref:D-alanyl-D-alanine carboxypeptidase family protein n=1 Tax=unclassified Streptomyces TaxID=2593676 RepID=UPI002E2A0B64|nr:serine hydrolase [Streptomyces sp. NBC_00190]WSZ38604.1 D-alanyl-D-alanine carboxypeptidase [Streptomyces sp. NBC_00868]
MSIRSSGRRTGSGAAALAIGASALLAPTAAGLPRADPLPPRPASSVGASLLHGSGTHVRARPGAPALPDDVSALSWLVADVRTGEVLAAHEAHRRLPPASTLKTLFALTALPRLPASSRHTVTEAELDEVPDGSSTVGVSADHTYRAADLWRGVFLSSGNDAVHVLAEMNGGWDVTAAQMQAKARALGARDTTVVSPDGYDADGQVSSAYDLAVFGRTGLADPAFAAYAATADARFPGGTHSDGTPTWTFGIENTNRLVTGEDGVGRYPGIVGVKNGYTSQAGYTLIAAARRGGRTLLVTVMNPQRGGGNAVYEEAWSLLDWGFAAAGHVDPVGSLAPPASPGTPRTVSAPVRATAPERPRTSTHRTYVVSAVFLAAAGLAGAGVLCTRRSGRRGAGRARTP